MSDLLLEKGMSVSKTDIAASQDIRLSSSFNAMANTFKVFFFFYF
jgi:hypothetical protein